MLYCFNHNFRKKASEYAFGKKYLSMITLEQSAIVLEPNNWNLKEEDNYELQLIWKITKIFKDNKYEQDQKNIQFKHKQDGVYVKID